jgi:histidine triad (HIT) family protein
MPSIFTRIVAGEIPSYKIAEDDHYYAFLDINPLAKGHTLVIPKKEIDYIFDLDDEHYQGLFLFAKRVAIAIKKVIPCEKVGVAVIGLEVLHAHIHLVPLNSISDLNFSNPKLKLDAEELRTIAEKIRMELGNEGVRG